MMIKFYSIFFIFTICFASALGVYADDKTTSKSIRINNITITIKVDDKNENRGGNFSINKSSSTKKIVKELQNSKSTDKTDKKKSVLQQSNTDKNSKETDKVLKESKDKKGGNITDKDYILPKKGVYIGKKGDGKGSNFGWFFRYSFSLLIITSLMGGAFLLLKKLRLRYLPEVAENEIRVLSKVSLDQRSKLVLIRVRGSDFLLSNGGSGLGLIKEFESESKDELIAKDDSTKEKDCVE